MLFRIVKCHSRYDILLRNKTAVSVF